MDRPGTAAYYNCSHGDGQRKRNRQPSLRVTTTDFPTAANHTFYTRLNQLLSDLTSSHSSNPYPPHL
jgi:hypothetical protein